MNVTRTFNGLEVALKPSGYGRFGGATFLLLWLAFWVVGEVLVGGLLIRGGWSVLTGLPPGEGRAPLETAPALGMGVFLLGWFAFWTLGGVLAGREVLRLLFGRDRIVLRPDALVAQRGFGLFRVRREIPRDRVRRFHRLKHGNVLTADTLNGGVELTRLGTADELEHVAAALNADWKLDPDAPLAGVLPDGWSEVLTPEGDAILIRDPSLRRKQAVVAWLIFLLLASVSGYILHAATAQMSLLAIGLMIATVAGFVGWGAYQLTCCRDEWMLGVGHLRLQRRVRDQTQPRYEAAALSLQEDRDSDGDPRYWLVALNGSVSPWLPLHEVRRQGRVVMNAVGDPTDVRNLGRWLAQRCALPLQDGTTTEAKEQEAERLREQLAASGRLGRWLAQRLRGAGAKGS